MSYRPFLRHAELDSASHSVIFWHTVNENLKPPAGGQFDVRNMMHRRYSKYFLMFLKKSFLLSALTLILSAGGWAQQYNVSGKVVEQLSNEPLPGTSLAIYSLPDSAMIAGAVANADGQFRIEGIPAGNYFLLASFIGFENDTQQISDLKADRNVGTLVLKASSLLLEEVSVSNEKSLVTRDLEKQVYHVERDVMAKSSTVTEILQNIPGITVDINGGVTLRNSSNITYFVNGKPSALLRRNPTTVLQQLPANTVKRIEVITNPSAKYRPDGIGGIINIVMDKNTGEGFSGQISANAGNEQRYNTNINLNYGKEDLKIFGNYSLRHANRTVLFTDEREYKDSISNKVNRYYNETGNSKNNAFSHNAYAGLTYDLNDYNSLEFSGSYFQQNSHHKGNSEIESLFPSLSPEYKYKTKETNEEYEKEGELSFTFEHVFKNNEDHTLAFDATYAAYDEQEDKTFEQQYSFPSDIVQTNKFLIQKSGKQAEIELNYTLPLGEDAELESGYAGEFIEDDIRYTADRSGNRFLFNRQLHALYALYGNSLGDFSFKAGVRAEQTIQNSHLISPIDSLVPDNYLKVFPTLHLGYDLAENKQLLLSYSKRVNRADSDELNPNPEYSDPRNAEAGNPYLKPEQIHSLELSYLYDNDDNSLSATAYYRYKYDAFTPIFITIGDSVVVQTATNLSTSQSGGVEGTWSGKLFEIWNYNLTGDVFYTTIDATNLGYDTKSSLSGNIKGYSLFKLARNTSLQLNAYYYFRRITPQGYRKPYYYFNAGLKQNLFKNKASLTFTATDIFHTYKIRHVINSPQLNQVSSINRKQPVFYLGFIWRFNNSNEKETIEFENGGLVK